VLLQLVLGWLAAVAVGIGKVMLEPLLGAAAAAVVVA
jgi:hypothetical protein